MKQFVLHPSAWARYSWLTKLRLRLWALRHWSKIEVNPICPKKYIYLFDPKYVVHLTPMTSEIAQLVAPPLTEARLIRAYGDIVLRPDSTHGKITYMGES